MMKQNFLQRKHRNNFLLPETRRYLKAFNRRFSRDYVIDCIEKLRNLKVLVVGEAIIDEYQFGSAIGKSAKEPIVALQYIKKEMYAGGSLAIANHLSDFCKEVGLFALLGERGSNIGFIKRNLRKNVRPFFFYKKNSPTIIKRRFIETSPFQKLLEFYVLNDSELDKEQGKKMMAELRPLLSKYDLVVCADFGHGMMDEKVRDLLIKKSRFLAVTAQVNAGNFGYHTISKYRRADFVCLDERELRLEAKKRSGDTGELAREVMKQLNYRYLIFTKGESGCYIYPKNNKIIHVPALNYRHVDRVGAGDAFLAITAPLLFSRIPLEVVGFFGNAVGALAVNTIGNKVSITKKALYDFLDSLLNQEPKRIKAI